MKKKKLVKLVLIILVILAIILVTIKIISKKENGIKRLANLYNTLNTSQTYLFEMEKDNENKKILAKKGDKMMIDQYSKDSHSTIILKDNNTFYVLHDREEYYVYEPDSEDQSILTDGISEVMQKPFTTGTEKIKGKSYTYEEYAGSTMFIITSTLDISGEDVKTRFYFDKGGNLAYIKTIYGGYQELLKIKLATEVDDSLFEIPSNYAEN